MAGAGVACAGVGAAADVAVCGCAGGAAADACCAVDAAVCGCAGGAAAAVCCCCAGGAAAAVCCCCVGAGVGGCAGAAGLKEAGGAGDTRPWLAAPLESALQHRVQPAAIL